MKLCLFFTCVILYNFSALALVVTDRSEIDGNESDITEIDLSNKGLSEFPMEILQCKNLISLNLSDNGIINIPIELSKLEQLKTLDLSGNQGVSYADLGELFNHAVFRLQNLDLADCEMGFIPQEIGKLKTLKTLDVSGNMLNNLPYTSIQLSKLEELSVANNSISDLSWQVYQWWNLRNLDVSNNPELKTDDLLFSLSICDGLDRLVLSHLTNIPPEFKNLKVDELEIRNSHIIGFPRIETSVPIKHLSFTRCTFQRPAKIAEIINKCVQPSLIRFSEIKQEELVYFLSVNADSVDIRNNDLTDIRVLAGMKQLKWVDARGNQIDESSIAQFKTNRPDIEILLAEPVVPNVGVNPPVARFVKKPTVRSIDANQSNKLSIGRTEFDIPENAFLDKNGNQYNGEVQLAYVEYFNPTEIFLSGITMTSDSANENLVFSSAGMFSLTATDDVGNELDLNPNTPIDVTMKSSNPSRDMNLYFLNDQGIWEYKGKDSIQEPFIVDQDKVDSIANLAFLNYQRKNIVVTENRFTPIVEGDPDTRSFTISFNELETNSYKDDVSVNAQQSFIKRPGNGASFVGKTKLVYDGDKDSAQFYKKWFKTVQRQSKNSYNKFRKRQGARITYDYEWGINYISKLNLSLDAKSDRMRLSFMYKDSAVSVPVVLKSSPSNPRARVKIFQRFFKGYNRVMKKDRLETNRRNREAVRLVMKEEMTIRNMAREREVARQKLYYDNKDYLEKVADVSSVTRSFMIGGFGIWNCDQRSRMSEPTNLPREFVSEDGQHINLKDTTMTVYVIDYDKNGVFSFYDRKQAFFDNKAEKMAIVVFFSSVVVGVYQSWRKFKPEAERDNEQIPLRQLDISNMKTKGFLDFIEN